MSYTIAIYPVELMQYIQNGGDWDDEQAESITFTEGTLKRLLERLIRCDYKLTHERDGIQEYEKSFGNLPVQVSVSDTEVAFSCPYWEGFSDHVFDIRMDALELSDSEELAFHDPQEDEWNQGLTGD